MRRVLSLAVCIILAASMFSGCGKAERPLTVDELLDLGEKFLLDMDYEQALVQFLHVIDIEPMNPRGYTGAAEAYMGLGDNERAKAILEQGRSVLGDDAGIQRFLDEISPPQEPITEPLPEPTPEPDSTANDEMEIYLSEVLALYAAGGYEAILELIDSEEFSELLAGITDLPFILLNDTEDYGIGIYEDGYIYIGDYVDRQREGYGLWTQSNGSNYYDGEWAYDLPNGSGTVFFTYSEHWIITGTLADGFWNGSVSETVGGGDHIFIVQFVNGKVITTGESVIHDDGIERWPTSHSEENQDSPDWFWAADEINGSHGVMPFAQYSY